MKYIEFGIYTSEDYIFLTTFVGGMLVYGLMFPIRSIKEISNKTVNNYLINNYENIDQIFFLDDEEIKTLNLSYLGKVSKKLQKPLRFHFDKLLKERGNKRRKL